MKISCEMAEDLLPLYLDGSCSMDSRNVVEEHLANCPGCHAKLSRMQSDITEGMQMRVKVQEPGLADYAKRIRRHRIRMAEFTVLVILTLSVMLAVGYLTIQDMYRQAHPDVREVEQGTYNLVAGAVDTTAEQIEQFVFYTNNTQIQVRVLQEEGWQGSGTIKLWNTIYKDNFIQIADIGGGTGSVTFTNLSSANRYKITCENMDGALLTVSDGRSISFWKSLRAVLGEIFRIL